MFLHILPIKEQLTELAAGDPLPVYPKTGKQTNNQISYVSMQLSSLKLGVITECSGNLSTVGQQRITQSG